MDLTKISLPHSHQVLPIPDKNTTRNNLASNKDQEDPFGLKETDPFILEEQITQEGGIPNFKKIAEYFIGLTSRFSRIILGDEEMTPQATEAHAIRQQQVLDYALHLYFNGNEEGAKQIWQYIEGRCGDKLFSCFDFTRSRKEVAHCCDAADIAPTFLTHNIYLAAQSEGRKIAQFLLGQLYLDELPQVKNNEQAKKIFQYSQPEDSRLTNIEKAAQCFLQSARQGYEPALNALKKLVGTESAVNLFPVGSEIKLFVQQFLVELETEQQAKITLHEQEKKELQQAENQMKKKLGDDMYEEGRRLEVSPFSIKKTFINKQDEVILLYQRAVGLNNADAAYRLGEIHKNRIESFFSSSIENAEEALKYYLKAGELGHPAAGEAAINLMFHLGELHQNCIGLISPSITEAKKALDYYSKADDLGHPKAIDEINKLKDKFPGLFKNRIIN